MDIIRTQTEKQTALSRQLGDIRLQLMQAGTDQAALEKFDEFANRFSDTGEQLNGLLSDGTDQAQALRETMLQLDSHAGASVIERESQDEARPAAATPAGNEAEQMATLRSATEKFAQIAESMKAQINQLLTAAPTLTNVKVRKVFENWKPKSKHISSSFPQSRRKTSRVGSEQTGACILRDHVVSVWHAMDHRKFLAGLVRHHSVVCGFTVGLDCRAADCCPSRSLWSDLRERGCVTD